MNRVLKWSGIVFASLIAVLAVSAVSLYAYGASRLNKAPQVTVHAVTVPTDDAAIERGRHLAHFVTGCAGCHGADFAGRVFVDQAPIGLITAPNLTSGSGGIGEIYTDEDWVRAIRHGIGKDGRVLGGMPSNYLARLSNEDLGAIIAYMKTVLAVDNDLPARAISFPGTILFGVLGYGDLPVAKIDHAFVSTPSPLSEVSAAYGEYLTTVATCGDCHGANLAGYTGMPGPPPGPDLTRSGRLGAWTDADFLILFRSGRTPEGHLVGEGMPWQGYAGMTDDELTAIWLYLQSLPNELVAGE